jgi:DNA-binding NarL/FixJ family response regulator
MDKAMKNMTTLDELMVRLFKVPRILVVQDRAAPAVGLLHQTYECQVDMTDSGEQAIEYLMEHRYDLVIIDAELLNGTSRKVISVAQEFAPLTPIVASLVTVLTGQITEENLARLFQVFKIKARTHALSDYFRMSRPTPVEA